VSINYENRFFFRANGCILTKLSLSLISPSLCQFGFLLHPNPQMAVSLRCEFRVAHTVKQFVKLFAIQYGLTFCLLRALTTHIMMHHYTLLPD